MCTYTYKYSYDCLGKTIYPSSVCESYVYYIDEYIIRGEKILFVYNVLYIFNFIIIFAINPVRPPTTFH